MRVETRRVSSHKPSGRSRSRASVPGTRCSRRLPTGPSLTGCRFRPEASGTSPSVVATHRPSATADGVQHALIRDRYLQGDSRTISTNERGAGRGRLPDETSPLPARGEAFHPTPTLARMACKGRCRGAGVASAETRMRFVVAATAVATCSTIVGRADRGCGVSRTRVVSASSPPSSRFASGWYSRIDRPTRLVDDKLLRKGAANCGAIGPA